MAKGIVVVDVPEACGYCACCKHDALYTRYCGANKRDLMNDIDWNLEKPDWCPIKPCYSNEDSNTSLIGEEKESVVLSPKEFIELLRKAPENDILMVEINDGKDESGVIEDVLVGGGTSKGFTFIKVSTDI